MVSHGGVQERNRVSQKHLLKLCAKVVVCINAGDPCMCVVNTHIKHIKSADYELVDKHVHKLHKGQHKPLSMTVCVEYTYRFH